MTRVIDGLLAFLFVVFLLVTFEAIRECLNCAGACGPNETVSTEIGGACRCTPYRRSSLKCREGE